MGSFLERNFVLQHRYFVEICFIYQRSYKFISQQTEGNNSPLSISCQQTNQQSKVQNTVNFGEVRFQSHVAEATQMIFFNNIYIRNFYEFGSVSNFVPTQQLLCIPSRTVKFGNFHFQFVKPIPHSLLNAFKFP